MWDSNSPLQLINSMPKKLSKENLEKLQLVIDADKYKNSLISGFDLCGMYAPFCRGCKKTSIYPCAIAYINMLKAGGADIEIDAKPVEPTESDITVSVSEVTPPVIEEVKPVQQEEVEEETEIQETAVAAVIEEVTEIEPEAVISEPMPAVEESVQEETLPLKRRIRIAVARRKM